MDKNIQISESLNNLYNNLLTQYMNIQMGVNSGNLTKQQATTMLANVAKMLKTGSLSLFKAEGFDSYLSKQYSSLYKDLIDQMQEYLQTELNPTRSL